MFRPLRIGLIPMFETDSGKYSDFLPDDEIFLLTGTIVYLLTNITSLYLLTPFSSVIIYSHHHFLIQARECKRLFIPD